MKRLGNRLLAILVSTTALASAFRSHGQPAAPPPAATLQQRLDRLCEQLEQQRLAMHIPGMAIAIVKDDAIILSRGFGERDVENGLSATDETLFAIGSTTKAFTATLIGILMDEGKMNWDDSPRNFLPGFHLNDEKADEQVQIRDLLSHRTGLGNTDLLWASGKTSREEILTAVAHAELMTPFRSKFQYNNVMFLAAGQCAGAAAASEWDVLLSQRILKPLNMTSTTTSLSGAQNNPLLSKGYEWDQTKAEFKRKLMRNLANIAPAGAINSNVKDMAQWIRLLLNRGEIDGKRLISKDRVEEIWTKQITVAGDVNYGLGWMLQTWNKRRVVEHGGNIDGFAAQVSLLPDDNIGYVLLTNVTATPLQQTSINLVFDALLGNWNESDQPLDVADAQQYLGKYHFDLLKCDVTVLILNNKLAVDVPGQTIYELKPPDDSGKRYFEATDQIAISFVRDEAENVTGMQLYQGGLVFDLPRNGVKQPIDITAADAQQYLGSFHSDELKVDFKVLRRNGRLAVDVPNQMVYELHPPDQAGLWKFRAKDTIAARFDRDESGAISAMTLLQNGHEFQMPRVRSEPTEQMPTLDEIIALHDKGYGTGKLAEIKNVRMTGTIRLINQGVSGTVELTAAGPNRFVETLDFGKFGYLAVALNDDRAWSDSAFSELEELHGDLVDRTRLQHPIALAFDWPSLFKTVEIVGPEMLNGTRAYEVRLQYSDSMSSTAFLDAATGLVLKEEIDVQHPAAGNIPTTITFDSYRDVEGAKLPMHFTLNNNINGKSVIDIDHVETNIDLPDDAFTLQPQPKR